MLPKQLKCNKCQSSQVFLSPDKENFLCRSCYSYYIEKRVKKSIRKYKMFEYGARVAVGLSGGKDSVVLLHILKKITENQNIKLSAIIIDEGVENYRNEGISIALDLVKKLEIPYKLLSYKYLYDTTLDTMVEIKPLGKSSCALCGTFRRKALNYGALSLEADLIATGHNLDDEAQTILMNMLRGDINRFTRSSKKPNQLHEKFIPRIKPIIEISQPEVVYYALANNLKYLDEECPYAPQARRNSVKTFLFDQEKKHNGTLINILRMQEEILLSIASSNNNIDKEFFECKICGDLTDDNITSVCAGCKFREEMKKN